jgi:predicted glycosyltransferase
VLGQAPDGTTRPSRTRHIIVSAGGGLVGEPLFEAALAAQPLLWRTERVEMHVVAGPFLPDPAWLRLRQQAAGRPGLRVRRFVPDLRGQLQRAAGSVSQCGYNTALDILASHVPGLVVPYTTASEDEQVRRARRLEALGALRVLPPDRLDAPMLLREMRALLHFSPSTVAVDLNGAQHTAEIIEALVRARRAA